MTTLNLNRLASDELRVGGLGRSAAEKFAGAWLATVVGRPTNGSPRYLSSHVIHCARDWLARIIHSQLRLLAPRLDNENHTKDIDFTSAGIRLRWEAGYAHTMRALERRAW
jgi:Patatin phospholipase